DFQQKVNYQRALEGEIANNIGTIDGVNSATVQLSLPEDQLFADESKPATAAVLLDSADMDPAQIRGMAKLVSGAVEGLKEEDVTITAADGSLLWPVGENGQPGGGSTSKISAENRYAAQLEGKINAKLTQMLGANKAYVQVSPTLNMNDISRDTLTWGDKGTALTSKSEKEQLESQGEAATPSGVRAQLEDAAATGAGSQSNYNRESKEDSFGVDKQVERTKVAQGAVEKLDVAVVFDKTVPKADVSEMEAYVANAAGVDTQRGDNLSVSQIAFAKAAKPEEAKGGPVPKAAAGAAKWVGLGIAGLLFLFFVTRALRKRESEALGDARWLTEIDEPRPLAELTAAGGAPQGSTLPQAAPPSAARTQIGEMVDKEPEKVAQQLRAWMSEES
ncbi:MAG: hypothetical protein JHC95_18805, partial [Solirubrobacteraceae bacterium]|nr:hypothetical protein [Solirubrobacteraceae bacterium]